MLTAGIHEAYNSGVAKFGQVEGLQLVAQGSDPGAGCAARAARDRGEADTYLGNAALEDEGFGPAAVLVRFKDADQLLRAAEHF
ncbi:hypothetical protein KQ754_15765, partial [Listeria monocytogenes]|nr:hypothetical protein [Listeria monocytogenes]